MLSTSFYVRKLLQTCNIYIQICNKAIEKFALKNYDQPQYHFLPFCDIHVYKLQYYVCIILAAQWVQQQSSSYKASLL
jgi:hypothetical protein